MVGEQITFTIIERCVNAGNCGNSFPLVDTLPSGLTVDSVDAEGPFLPSNYECSTSGNTVTCPGGRISCKSCSITPSEQQFTLTIVATTTECGSFTNKASNGVDADGAEATFTVEGCPPPLPTTKAQCKKGGWRDFGYPDQGTCVSDVNRRNR